MQSSGCWAANNSFKRCNVVIVSGSEVGFSTSSSLWGLIYHETGHILFLFDPIPFLTSIQDHYVLPSVKDKRREADWDRQW